MRTAGIKCVVFVVVLTLLLSLVEGDTDVSCVLMESCILPCSFRPDDRTVIHWIQGPTETETPVHSYYYDQDQFENQHSYFKNRTSLFKDQISRGNASLQLTKVEVQDQGRYRCYTSSDSGPEESFINLKVNAPVRKVDIQQVENSITCSSEGIYPQPELSWSTNPPSIETFRNTTTVQQNEQQLYTINSSLILSDNFPDLVYSCTVSTRRNKKKATLFKPYCSPRAAGTAETEGTEGPVGIAVGVGAALLVLLVIGGLLNILHKKEKHFWIKPQKNSAQTGTGHTQSVQHPPASQDSVPPEAVPMMEHNTEGQT